LNYKYTIKELKNKFLKAVNLLYRNDLFLLKNNVSERAITHKLAFYLQDEFPEWHVDCEYNRDTYLIKRRNSGLIFNPDIIVHIRDTKNNILIIEVKKSNGSYNKERERLSEVTHKKSKYNYPLGVYIIFPVLKDYNNEPEIYFYQNGRCING